MPGTVVRVFPPRGTRTSTYFLLFLLLCFIGVFFCAFNLALRIPQDSRAQRGLRPPRTACTCANTAARAPHAAIGACPFVLNECGVISLLGVESSAACTSIYFGSYPFGVDRIRFNVQRFNKLSLPSKLFSRLFFCIKMSATVSDLQHVHAATGRCV